MVPGALGPNGASDFRFGKTQGKRPNRGRDRREEVFADRRTALRGTALGMGAKSLANTRAKIHFLDAEGRSTPFDRKLLGESGVLKGKPVGSEELHTDLKLAVAPVLSAFVVGIGQEPWADPTDRRGIGPEGLAATSIVMEHPKILADSAVSGFHLGD